VRIYLAGAIRDEHPEDILWRETFIDNLPRNAVEIFNPLASKKHDLVTGEWTICGLSTTGPLIVRSDFWMVDNSDMIVFNLLPLGEGYASLGTLIEFGRATSRVRPIFTILPEFYKGHENVKAFGLHPFLKENSSHVFNSTEACLDFLKQYVLALSGKQPHFGRS